MIAVQNICHMSTTCIIAFCGFCAANIARRLFTCRLLCGDPLVGVPKMDDSSIQIWVGQNCRREGFCPAINDRNDFYLSAAHHVCLTMCESGCSTTTWAGLPCVVPLHFTAILCIYVRSYSCHCNLAPWPHLTPSKQIFGHLVYSHTEGGSKNRVCICRYTCCNNDCPCSGRMNEQVSLHLLLDLWSKLA